MLCDPNLDSNIIIYPCFQATQQLCVAKAGEQPGNNSFCKTETHNTQHRKKFYYILDQNTLGFRGTDTH